MIKNFFMLFKIGRKLALSGVLTYISEIYKIPAAVRFLFFVIGFSFNKNRKIENISQGLKICNALEDMGTTFIKLGQFLATRPDIIGESVAKDLEKLQDKLPPFSLDEAKEILKKNLGEEKFLKIKDLSEPVAAASIAQVHFAKINDEKNIYDVAIKILRPNISKIFNEELDALMLLSYIVESLSKKTKRLKLIETVHLLREITNVEMDLRFEAAAANELYENTKKDSGFVVPKIYWNFTTKKVLCLDKINAVSIREVELLKSKNIDLKKLSQNLIQNFLKHAIRDGFFHADMHQGNLFVDESGNIIPVDFGIMGRLSKNNRKYLAEILFGFIKRDYEKVAEIHLLAGLVNKGVNKSEFAQALRSIGEPIFGQSIKDISGGNLLSQLFEITEKFNMHTQTQLLLLQKTMVVVEGVARKIYPDTNIWIVSKPILEDWLTNLKSPMGKVDEVFQNTSEIIKRLPEFPIIMDKANEIITLMAEGKFDPNSLAYKSLKENELKLKLIRTKMVSGFLLLVILMLLVF